MNKMFDKFAETDYCVLRPMKPGSDIDVLVCKKDYPNMRRIFLANGYVEVIKGAHQRLFRKMTPSGVIDFHIFIDGLSYYNMIYYPAKEILPTKIPYENYFVPDKETYLMANELHQAIDRNKYGADAKVNLLKKVGTNAEAWTMIWLIIKQRIEHRKKRGIDISVIGCNGTGKSTQAELLNAYLNKNGISSKFIRLGCYHSRSGAGLALDKAHSYLLGNQKKPNTDENYRFKQKSMLKNWFRLWDIRNRYNAEKGKEQVRCIDRGYYDTLLYGVPDKFSRFLLRRVLKKPDFVFYFTGDPKIIAQRRSINPDTLTEQDARLRARLDRLGVDYVEINTTSKNEQESFEQMLKELNSWKFFRRL